MPSPVKGPRGDHIPLDHLPIERLREVLPETSPLGDTVADDTRQTGLLIASDAEHGYEPWLFDENHMVLLADTNPGPANQTSIEFVVYLGETYIFGFDVEFVTQPTPPFVTTIYTGFVGTVDEDTGVVTRVLEADDAILSRPTVVDGQIYVFSTRMDQDPDVPLFSLKVFNPVTGKLGDVALPESVGQLTQWNSLTEWNGELFIVGATSGGYDLLRYDPGADLWASYQVPGTVGNLMVTAGAVWLTSWDGQVGFNLYSVDLSTGAVSHVVGGSGIFEVYEMGEDIVIFTPSPPNSSSLYTLYKVEGDTGVLQQVLQSDDHMVWLGSGDDEAFFRMEDAGPGDSYDIYKIADASSDGATATRYDLNAYSLPLTGGGKVLDGTLYSAATLTQGGLPGIYYLDETTGTLQGIGPSVTGAAPRFEAVINDHLAIVADYDLDGDFELWMTAAPTDLSSWHNITPDGVSVLYVQDIYQGDFLI